MKEFSEEIFNPRKQYRIENYIGKDDTVCTYMNMLNDPYQRLIVLRGEKGSGITHLMHAGANQLQQQGKRVCVMTSEWFVEMCKLMDTEEKQKDNLQWIMGYDIFMLDNIQFLHRKNRKWQMRLKEIANEMVHGWNKVVLGCSNPKKDISNSKIFSWPTEINRIHLESSGSHTVFKILKGLCTPEDRVPDHLIYLISGYNGTAQQYINCLVSVRFKSKIDQLNLASMSLEEFELHFKISSYFHPQQFRKHLVQKSIVFREAYMKMLVKKPV